MTLADTPTSQRKPLPSFVRRLAIALAATLVGALAVSASWLMHRPVGYSGNALTPRSEAVTSQATSKPEAKSGEIREDVCADHCGTT